MHKIQLYNHTRHPSNLLERFSPSLSVHLIAIVVFNCVCVCVCKQKKKQVSSDTDSLVYPFPAFSLSRNAHIIFQLKCSNSDSSGRQFPVHIYLYLATEISIPPPRRSTCVFIKRALPPCDLFSIGCTLLLPFSLLKSHSNLPLSCQIQPSVVSITTFFLLSSHNQSCPCYQCNYRRFYRNGSFK